MRHDIGFFVQLTIGERGIFGNERCFVGVFSCAAFKEPVQERFSRFCFGAGFEGIEQLLLAFGQGQCFTHRSCIFAKEL